MLELVGARSIIEHSYARARESGASRVIVATDDERIAKLMRAVGAECCMTSSDCASGSDRLAEACAQLELPAQSVVVNLQGDEPFMPPKCIDLCAQTLLANPDSAVATLAVSCETENYDNPNAVKVVLDQHQRALYFSRARIPYPRQATPQPVLRHLGIYAYRASFLSQLPQLPATPLEQSEQLEQLRILEHGQRISVAVTPTAPPPGIDSWEELRSARAYYARQAINYGSSE